jgi:hypothetical protein
LSAASKAPLGALVAIAALALAGCGGCGGGERSTTTSSAPAPVAQAQEGGGQEESAKPAKPSTGDAAGQANRHAVKHKQVRIPPVPPISSAPVEGSKAPAPGVKTVKGGDNSVQSYGSESGSEDRTEAAIAVQAYLADRLAEDWEGACSQLAEVISSGLRRMADKAQAEGKNVSGCAGAMGALSEGVSESTLRESATIEEVLSFRIEGSQGDIAFLLYRGPPESTLYSVPMYLEGGQWKVGSIFPNVLEV